MTRSEIEAMQARVGTTVDGVWGPRSQASCQAHLRGLKPRFAGWPEQNQMALQAYYGSAGDESRLVNLPVSDLLMMYDGERVKTIRCHARVANSLRRVLEAIANSPHAAILGKYAGCYNNRKMRGGSLPSLHARGAAIDLDPDNNGNFAAWPQSSTMPFEVMELFAAEGWLSAGAEWGRDAMHFQATC